MKSIPDKIAYVYHTSVKIEVNSNEIEVYPSYVADFDNEIDLNNARRFVKHYKNILLRSPEHESSYALAWR